MKPSENVHSISLPPGVWRVESYCREVENYGFLKLAVRGARKFLAGNIP